MGKFKRGIALSVLSMALLGIAGCTDSEDEGAGIKENEEPKSLGKITEKLLKDTENRTHATYGEVLLSYLLHKHGDYEQADVDAYLKDMKGFMEINGLDSISDENLLANAVDSVATENALLGVLNITREDVRKEQEAQTGLRTVAHAIILQTPDDISKEAFKAQIKEEMGAVKEQKDLAALQEKYAGAVDFLTDMFGAHNVLTGFEGILSAKIGEQLEFGNETYTSIMRVLEINKNAPFDEFLQVYGAYASSRFASALSFAEYWLEAQGLQYDIEVTEEFLATETEAYAQYIAEMTARNAKNETDNNVEAAEEENN